MEQETLINAVPRLRSSGLMIEVANRRGRNRTWDIPNALPATGNSRDRNRSYTAHDQMLRNLCVEQLQAVKECFSMVDHQSAAMIVIIQLAWWCGLGAKWLLLTRCGQKPAAKKSPNRLTGRYVREEDCTVLP